MIKVVIFCLIVLVLGYIVLKIIKRGQSFASGKDGASTTIHTVKPHNKKLSIKMMTYQEALEASKQFIYNITKAVMQRFTPDAQQDLIDIGKKLVQNGVSYLHVVDVAALSAEKEKQLSHLGKQGGKSIGIKK